MASVGKRRYISLQLSMQLAMLGVVVLGLTWIIYLAIVQERNVVEERTTGELRNQLDTHSAQFAEVINDLANDTRFLANTPPVSGIHRAEANHGIDPVEQDSYDTWVNRLQRIFVAYTQNKPFVHQVRYIRVDGCGREIARVNRVAGGAIAVADPDKLQCKSERPYFQKALSLRPGEIEISEFNLEQQFGAITQDENPSLRLVTPVYRPDGHMFGLLIVSARARDLLSVLQPRSSRGPLAFVTNERGDYLVHPEPHRTFTFELGGSDTLERDFPALVPIFSAHTLVPVEIDIDGTTHWAVTQRLHFDRSHPERFLVVVYAAPTSAFIPPFRNIVQLILLGVVVVLILGVILTALVNRLFQPMETLTAAANIVAGGDFNVNFPESRVSEIDALVRAFRTMIMAVRTREDDYRTLNAELEQRIAQGTAQVRQAATVMENTSEGVLITDSQGVIVSVNKAFTNITGYSAAEAIGCKPNLLRSDRHDASFYHAMWSSLCRHGSWQGEIWNRHKNGAAYLQRMTINRVPGHDGTITGYISIFDDITDRHAKDEQIRHLAFHDALTGLANRSLFHDRLEHAVARSRRENEQLSVTLVDLDGFKVINDTHGHDVGDELLKEIAMRIHSRMRRDIDTVARLGGDEFVILMEDLKDVDHCTTLVRAILDDIEQPVVLRNHTLRVSASLGIAVFPTDGSEAAELLKHADLAMYAAKSAGKGTFRFFAALDSDSEHATSTS